jgi:hypothetical protein
MESGLLYWPRRRLRNSFRASIASLAPRNASAKTAGKRRRFWLKVDRPPVGGKRNVVMMKHVKRGTDIKTLKINRSRKIQEIISRNV